MSINPSVTSKCDVNLYMDFFLYLKDITCLIEDGELQIFIEVKLRFDYKLQRSATIIRQVELLPVTMTDYVTSNQATRNALIT